MVAGNTNAILDDVREVSVWKGVGDGSALLDLWQSSHCSRGGCEARSQWERCPGPAL